MESECEDLQNTEIQYLTERSTKTVYQMLELRYSINYLKK